MPRTELGDHLVSPGRAQPRHRPPRRNQAPGTGAKACLDMIIALRRVLIAAQYNPGAPGPEEIHAIRLAWAQAAA